MTPSTSPSLSVNPSTRIQVLFENEPGQPTKEFNAGDLPELTFEALVTKVFAMSLPNETAQDQYNATFKYQIEERHESRWVNFENTEGLGFAIQSNQDKGYVFFSASIIKKGTAAPVPPSAVVSPSKPTKTAKPKVAKKAKTTKAKAPSRSGSGTKMSVEQKILTALKELFDIGIMAPPRLQVALFAGYGNVKSKSFANALSKLSKSGFIEYPDKKTARLTQAGIAKTGSVTPPSSNEQVHEKIKNLLKGTETKIFNELVDGRSHVREQVAATLGYSNVKSKSFANSLSKMSSLGFLAYVKDETNSKKNLVQLTDIAFPLGRPGVNSSTMSVVSNEDVTEF